MKTATADGHHGSRIDRKYRVPKPRGRKLGTGMVSWAEVRRQVNDACDRFWAKRGGRPDAGEFNYRTTARGAQA